VAGISRGRPSWPTLGFDLLPVPPKRLPHSFLMLERVGISNASRVEILELSTRRAAGKKKSTNSWLQAPDALKKTAKRRAAAVVLLSTRTNSKTARVGQPPGRAQCGANNVVHPRRLAYSRMHQSSFQGRDLIKFISFFAVKSEGRCRTEKAYRCGNWRRTFFFKAIHSQIQI
jgi:hypothetical protein